MPNTSVRAAAEGMPNIDRRRLLNLSGAGLALAATAMIAKPAPAATISKVAELEAAFHTEWQKHREMLPEHNAAEIAYFAEREKLVRPVMRKTSPEEIEAIRRLTIGELRDFKSFGNAADEYAEAIRTYAKADGLARRRTGFAKMDRAFVRQLDRAYAAANRLVRCPAQSFGDIAAKARVHRVWEFEGDDINYIMADIARVARKGVSHERRPVCRAGSGPNHRG